jgi:hypothetical protein
MSLTVRPVEGTNYQCSTTHPNIPFTLYVHEDHFLLVPRAVDKVHRAFPEGNRQCSSHAATWSDHTVAEYRTKHGNKTPRFEHEHVGFGWEEDEGIVICALQPDGRR